MANTASNFQEQDRIINAIENASDAELAALADIRHLLQKVSSGGDGLTISRPSRALSNLRTPQRNSLGLKLVEKTQVANQNKNEPQKGYKKGSNNTNERTKPKKDTNNPQKNTKTDTKESQKAQKTEATKNNDNLIPNSVSFKSYLRNKRALNNGSVNSSSAAAQQIVEEVKPQRFSPLRDLRTDKNERLRNASGRFASKDKTESLRAKKDGESERKANEKMQSGFLRRLGGVIGDSTKSLAESGDNSALDVAGSAGGSFWKAGKEAAGLLSNTKDNVVSLHDWVQGKRQEIEPAPKQVAIQPPTIRPLKLGGDKETTSEKEFSSKNQTQQTKAIQEQTKLNQVNDEKMIGLLEDIADKKSGNAGSGILGKILGAMGIKAIGKKIGGKLGAAIMAALSLKKLKSLLSKNAGGIGGDLDIDTDRTTGKGKKGKKGKKTKRSVRKAKKGNVLKRLVKGKAAAKVATAAVAAGGAAYAGKKILEGAGEQATESTIKKGAVKVTEKTVEKGSVKATEKAVEKGAAKVAEKGTEKVAKKGVEKVAAKGATKAAEKLATKTALKAVPLLGTAISAGMDAYDGYSDTDAQRETFGLKEGEEVSNRHKSEYALANVADMGGLVSGGAGLLASGAKWMGMDSAADALTFDTGDIAKSIDSKVSGVISLFSSENKKTAEGQNKQSEADKADIVKAVTEGADKTTKAINDLSSQMFGGKIGEDGIAVPVNGAMPVAPTENIFGDGLNIGGKNAQNRNFRNNNFGNLAYVGQKGARLEDANAKGEQRFAKFDTPEEGMRALASQITSYSNGTSKAANYQKLNTVESIISKYAPPNENNTKSYIANLSKSLGVSSTDQLDLTNPQVMTKMIRGISTIEGGNPQVTDKFIESSIGNYDAQSRAWKGQFSPETLAYVNKARAGKGLSELTSQDQYSSPEAAGVKITPSKSTPVKAIEPVANLPVAPAEVKAATKTAKPATKAVENASKVAESKPKASDPTSKAKFEESKAKSQPSKDKETSSDTGFWATLKKAREAADNKIAGYTKNVQGVRSIRPDAGLSLPKNVSASDLPAGLKMAMLPASQIAQASKSRRVENLAHTAQSQPEVYSGKSSPVSAPVMASAGSVVPASDLNRALPADYKAPQQAKQTGNITQSLADIVLPSAADTFKNMTQGFTSGGIIDDVVGSMGLGNGRARALSPLTGLMTKKIDSGVSGMVDSVSNSIRQPAGLTMPRSLPTVTDLAASGVKTPVTRDKSSSAQDKEMLLLLQKIATNTEKLFGLQKDSNNKGKDPNITSNSAQPAPRSDIPLGSQADALSQMLSDRV
ncbi:hypothetical protein NGK36_21775 [Hafnia alvei]|uniref:hypothetical protein n=1 Tax=Hafnia alvei TaxID=569 RepID=UPI002DBE6C88|nr:hypothetical protein [Hafnia alvei]MEB7891892.1 hypothetical protein [Hafnia alvei]